MINGRWSMVGMLAVVGGALILATVSTASATRKFFDDDPISREPETQDASKAQGRDINLVFDLAMNLFTRPGDSATDVPHQTLGCSCEVCGFLPSGSSPPAEL